MAYDECGSLDELEEFVERYSNAAKKLQDLLIQRVDHENTCIREKTVLDVIEELKITIGTLDKVDVGLAYSIDKPLPLLRLAPLDGGHMFHSMSNLTEYAVNGVIHMVRFHYACADYPINMKPHKAFMLEALNMWTNSAEIIFSMEDDEEEDVKRMKESLNE